MPTVSPTLAALLARHPAYDRSAVDTTLSTELARSNHKIVVLDDDPTGVQTVHDVSVYTDWEPESILKGFAEDAPMFFILTNSRSFTEEQTGKAHKEIACSIAAAAQKTGKPFLVISRGDSTLRGHYPLETLTLCNTLEQNTDIHFDGEILFPFFPEGGRYTADNIHYVSDGINLIPAGETEFAKDKTFGFKSSCLPDYIEEKTHGAFSAHSVTCITLEQLRARDYASIEQLLDGVFGFGKVVVNALEYEDVKVFTTSLLRALKTGKNFLFRTAAGFAKIIGGISDYPLLTYGQMVTTPVGHGGLIVAGSHVKKTTAQLEQLSIRSDIQTIVLDQHLVLEPSAFDREQQRVICLCEEYLERGITVVVMTRRDRLDLNTGNPEDELRIAAQISDAVTNVVRKLSVRPEFLIAKGGITSSDIGVKGLGVKKATVAGQIRPGVPVWITGSESRFPGLPYIIFPGNVGTDDDLRIAVETLMNTPLSLDQS